MVWIYKLLSLCRYYKMWQNEFCQHILTSLELIWPTSCFDGVCYIMSYVCIVNLFCGLIIGFLVLVILMERPSQRFICMFAVIRNAQWITYWCMHGRLSSQRQVIIGVWNRACPSEEQLCFQILTVELLSFVLTDDGKAEYVLAAGCVCPLYKCKKDVLVLHVIDP